MRRFLYGIVSGIVLIGVLAACSNTGTETEEAMMQNNTSWNPQPEAVSDRTQAAQAAYRELYGDAGLPLYETDPEFADIMNNFIYGDIYQQEGRLSNRQRELITIVSLVTQQSDDLLRLHVQGALNSEVLTPVEIKEAIYQCAPYVGFPRAVDALEVANEVFAANGISLPLEGQGTVNEETRFDLGLDAQATIFGDGMRQIAAVGVENMIPSSYYLVTNCFGDYYTRGGLDLQTREMLTLVILCNLGTESQIKSHIMGNVNMGQDKDFISDVIYQCLPYMGYPRLLNAQGYLNEVLPDEAAEQSDTEDSSDE